MTRSHSKLTPTLHTHARTRGRQVLHGVVSATLGTEQCKVTQRAFLLEILHCLKERELQLRQGH